jgi:hypothetical protein
MTKREGKPAHNRAPRTQTKPTPATERLTLDTAEWKHHPAFREISNERVKQLTDTILAQDDDEQAKAFIELIAAVAYTEDFGKRDDMAAAATRHAFSMTIECSRAENDFYLRIPRS